MKNIDYSTIYNLPEAVSGLGWKTHSVSIYMYIILFLLALPCISMENNWIKIFIESILSAGMLVTLGMTFIFILCPVYFFIRCIMEAFRTKKHKREFYSSPNIEYIKLNNDNLFLKNTCKNCDITVKKSDVKSVLLDGEIKTIYNPLGKGDSKIITYVENLTMTIITTKGDFIIYPSIYYVEILKEHIQFYKQYFANFNVNFDIEGTGAIAKAQSAITAYHLKYDDSENHTNPFENIVSTIFIIAFICYMILKNFI